MAAVQGSDVLEVSQVRIHSAAGGVVGAGFLVAPDVVCTCAHVVVQALEAQADVEDAHGEAVHLDFPLVDGSPQVRATVVSWRRGGTDVALLRLDAGVEGARPAPLVDGTKVWEHTFRAFGYPAGADHGVWASGRLRAGQGLGWVQMEAEQPGPHIMEGFSGGPVWDDEQGGVVGMTVAAHDGESTAYLLPSEALVDEDILKPRCPFKGLEAFAEDDAEFFRGRGGDKARVHTAVSGRDVTLVAGPSGCGKSSLVRAGVLPRLRDEGVRVTELRPVPGVRPAAVVARALIGVLEPDAGEVERLCKAGELERLLETDDDVLVELRSRVLARGERAGHVLFADQFEEYAGADPGAARDLFGMLAALAGKDRDAVLRVVATARPASLTTLVNPDTTDLVSDAVQFLAPLAADDLERAVTEPVDAVPGVWFEPGLPERIVADAGDEPGRMPLVQFVLAELWERRTSAMLTHAAYDDLGGVAGALVKYADETLAKLTAAQQECARRLFVQLARPGDGDTFSRRPTRTADLAPELLTLARKLAPGKLVILSRTPGGAKGEEMIDLAHEALIHLWPALRKWLVDSRDFRAWQEQLRNDLHRWQAQDRKADRLLSGTDLDEAERRLARHSGDISADERAYLQLSRSHSRRGARLKQAAVAALAVLTVLAVVLALSTWTSLKDTEERLRTQAAGLLAQAAEDRPGSDPTTAMQLALAAWNTKHTADTRQALLHQYARGQYLVGSYPSVWKGQVTGMDATTDGRTLVVRSKLRSSQRQTVSVVTGALQGRPSARQLTGVPAGDLVTALSPDGRLFAATARGAVRLWRLSDPGRPQVLGLGDYHLPEEAISTFLDFSSDGKRLLLSITQADNGCYLGTEPCDPPFLGVWQMPSGTRIDVSDRAVPERGLEGVAFTSDADTVASITSTFGSVRHRIELRNLTTGKLLYTSKGTRAGLRAGGEILFTVDGDRLAPTAYIQALGHAPGRRIVLPATKHHHVDATAQYGIDNIPYAHDSRLSPSGYAEAKLTDLRTGRAYRTRVPTSGETPAAYTGAAVVPRAGGELTVLVPVGSALMAVRAEAVGTGKLPDDAEGVVLSPDGRFLATISSGLLEVMDASRARLRSVKLPRRYAVSWGLAWTADSQRIVLWDDYGNLYRSYSVRDLSDSVPLGDALPKSKEVDTVAALQGSEIAVLTEDGILARVNAADGAGLGRPFLVDPTPNPPDASADAQVMSELVARPRHPGQVAVVTNSGAARGEILLWDTREVRRIAKLPGPGIVVPDHFRTVTHGLVFDADGSHLAVQNSDGRVHVWDVDDEKKLDSSAPRSTDDTLVGFGPGDSIVTYLADKVQIQIHDLTGDGASTTLAVEERDLSGGWLSGFVDGPYLTIETGDLRQTFDLRPDAQFRTLCAAAGRDYTKAELKLLPEGTPSNPPCA